MGIVIQVENGLVFARIFGAIRVRKTLPYPKVRKGFSDEVLRKKDRKGKTVFSLNGYRCLFSFLGAALLGAFFIGFDFSFNLFYLF